MSAYILRRLMTMAVTLIGITIVTFAIVNLAPGDPTEIMMGGMQSEEVDAEAFKRMREFYGLDKPLHVRYLTWISRVAVLDFGVSFKDNRPVWDKIKERLPNTIWLNIWSLIIAYSIAFPWGVMTAVKRKTTFDRVSAIVFFVGYSFPNFWFALLLQSYLSVQYDLFPLMGTHQMGSENWSFVARMMDYMHHSMMPLACLTVGSFAFFSRFIRANMLEVLKQDYIRTARAKGVAESVVIFRHAFRNTLIPVITLLATVLPQLLSGSVIIEKIFQWPGIGKLFFEAVLTRDYPTVMALSFITSTLILISLLLADVLYALVDPRISYS